jgi:hypothetical protein
MCYKQYRPLKSATEVHLMQKNAEKEKLQEFANKFNS